MRSFKTYFCIKVTHWQIVYLGHFMVRSKRVNETAKINQFICTLVKEQIKKQNIT